MTIVSLFSGAGGLDLGLIRAGHEVVWANDIDPDSCATYRLNIGHHIVCADIASVSLEDIPSADVIVGGFPCQGFSMANLRRTVDDDRNKLYKQFLRLVKGKKPQYFIAENVRGILSLDNGKAISRIVSDFTKAGYRVKYKLFNMADYGVPQTRMRVIIIGVRSDAPASAELDFPSPLRSKSDWITISEALRGIPEPEQDGSNLTNHVYSRYKVTDRNFTGHRTTDPHKPSPTILARGNGKGGVCAIQHPGNHRRMSVRESAIIQTFPVGYEFVGSMGSMYRQVGNAVPVLFAEQLGKMLSRAEMGIR